MKNRIMIFIVVGVLSCLFAGNSFAQNIKIGYVDTLKVFYSYNKTQKDMKIWQSEQTSQESKIASLQKEIKTLQDAYNKQKSLLKPAEAKKRKADIGKKFDALMSFENQANQSLTKEKDALITKLKDDIYSSVKIFAQKEKYDLILDSQAVLYAPPGNDVTDQIITILNKGENVNNKGTK
ncbi:MAG: OmpH family outer membrane protein [Candidatus Omnitrophica bacterium]|nr:OmpH family outer membrane protein [Candidatus Omnitrophota bacterium]